MRKILITLALITFGLSTNAKTVAEKFSDLHFYEIDTAYIARDWTPEQGADFLEQLKTLYTDRASWEKRKAAIAAGLRSVLLVPDNTEALPTPRHTTTAQLRCPAEGVVIENIGLEIADGIWVTGNLYRPADTSRYYPIILSAQGHGFEGVSAEAPRLIDDAQRMCIMLAQMGTVVFNYDMWARGESTSHFGHNAHNTGISGAIQTVSTMRVIDFLKSLPYTDAERIGMMGWSGGGTQTFIATAIDSRIRWAIIVTQISCFFPGGCTCESGLPIHITVTPQLNNCELAAMAAPRPLLLLSDGVDWTRTTPAAEYPFIRRTYAFYNAENQVGNIHFASDDHTYKRNRREAIINFVAKQWSLSTNDLRDPMGRYDFDHVNIHPWEQLVVFSHNDFPQNHVTSVAQAFSALKRLKNKSK